MEFVSTFSMVQVYPLCNFKSTLEVITCLFTYTVQ